MHILVTAGNTLMPIDRVRCITNIFTGRTGARIGLEGRRRGHQVSLLTSHPEVVVDLGRDQTLGDGWRLLPYRTFDELESLMADQVGRHTPDAVIHCAAVSDHRVAGIFAPDKETRFREPELRWEATAGSRPGLVDMMAGKVKSDAPELWLRLVRAPKLIDRIRSAWGFTGVLVKFKLEVDVSTEQLLTIAERSRTQSTADLMVANTLEGAGEWALLGPVAGAYERVDRPELPGRLLDQVEQLRQERQHG